MLQRTILALSLVLAFIIIAGCSSRTNPAVPSGDVLSGQPLVGVSDRFPDSSPASGMGALGIFNLSVNADEISAELTLLRQNSLTDVLEVVDITSFLQMAPCLDCARIKSVALDADGNVVVSIGIKHPFEEGNSLAPITGKNRGDLHVFNIEGTIISNIAGTAFTGIGESTAGFTLVNADGYTPYLDTVLDNIYPTDATVHPYILHFDDYSAGNFDALNPMGFDSVTDPPPSGNLVMAMGCDYDYQDYVFDIDGTFDFIYAVGCTYAVSTASCNERFAPEYRIPQHNKKAASEVSVEIVNNVLVSGVISSTAEIEISIVDVSHNIPTGIALDEMLADSSVSQIAVEIPGVMLDSLIIDGGNAVSGTGHDPSDPLIYSDIITNTANASMGTYNGLVKVTDTYKSGLNEALLLNGMDGIKRVDPLETPLSGLFSISEFAAYQVFNIAVGEHANVIYVDNSHSGPVYDGSIVNPYCNIMDGVNAAALLTDYVVWVDDSGYPYIEMVALADNVEVYSRNWDTSDGDNRAVIQTPNLDDNYAVRIDYITNAKLSGFQIRLNDYVQESGWGYITYIYITNSTGITMEDIYIHGEELMRSHIAMWIDDSTDIEIAYCHIEHLHGPDPGTQIESALCVMAENTSHMHIHNVRINHLGTNFNENGHSNTHAYWLANCDYLNIHNNVIYKIVLKSGYLGSGLATGYNLDGCYQPVLYNNTIHLIDTVENMFINQAFCYFIINSEGGTFYNNIASDAHASGMGTVDGRGVQSNPYDLPCDYTLIWDMGLPYFQDAYPNIGCRDTDPLFIDPENGLHDVAPASDAQLGNPDIVDWDDTGAPSGDPGNTDINTRSRMGCHGGPDGETVGLLT